MDLPDHFGCCTIASQINYQMNRTRVDCNSQLKEGHYTYCSSFITVYESSSLIKANGDIFNETFSFLSISVSLVKVDSTQTFSLHRVHKDIVKITSMNKVV